MNVYELGLRDWAMYYANEISHLSKDYDKELSIQYLEIANSLNKELSISNQKATAKLVDDLVKSHEKKHQEFVQRVIIICLSSLILIGLLIYFLINRHKKQIFKKEILLKQEQSMVTEKEKEKQTLQWRNKQLRKKVKENNFTELIQLAKNNHPEFVTLFKELYPEIVQKLQELNPEMRNSELAFFAMAYLNFSTKKIAQYSYVTIAAVQSRKNRIRKKYNIPSEIDFNKWVQELEN